MPASGSISKPATNPSCILMVAGARYISVVVTEFPGFLNEISGDASLGTALSPSSGSKLRGAQNVLHPSFIESCKKKR